jgi:exosortase A
MNMMGRIETAPARQAATLPADRGWRTALLVLGLGTLAWGLLFFPEIAAALQVWETSTAYNHCWLILPIAAWLAWQRRDRLAFLAPGPDWRLALLAIPGGLAWLSAERLGIMEGRQLAALGLFYVLVLAVLGWRFAWEFAGPLLYLVFLVPFGAFAVPVLQHITARLIDIGLGWWGITHYVDGLLIETPAGLFHVAEACAGLRFSIAALAFGALYALVIFRSPWRRLAVMALAVAVPILANGVRAGGIIVAAEYMGSAEAAAADHVIYGWGFFSAVILVLILAGLPFREDSSAPAAAPPGPPPRPAGTGALVAAGVAAVALTAAAPALAAGLAQGAAAPAETALRLAPPPGCAQAADGMGLDCGGLKISARLLAFSPLVNWSAVSAARWQLAEGGGDTDVTFGLRLSDGSQWQGRLADGQGRATAVAGWLDGHPAGNGLGPRILQAQNSLLGGHGVPVLAVVALRPAPGQPMAVNAPRDQAVLEAVLAAQDPALPALAAARSRKP